TWLYLFLIFIIFAYTPVRSVVEIYLVNTLLVPFAFGCVALEWLFVTIEIHGAKTYSLVLGITFECLITPSLVTLDRFAY
ncbi:hypothetical protein PSV08DRAFT_326264, partial [Bipolaris maydis]|uniref:uncharacterized protein n=1 Tax=Cochliobolus heterostrophus TaxID=5016 RepID=UPI0024D0F5DD